MIISQKQIMNLIFIATEFRNQMLSWQAIGRITPGGQQLLTEVSTFLTQIANQQSEELKEII